MPGFLRTLLPWQLTGQAQDPAYDLNHSHLHRQVLQ